MGYTPHVLVVGGGTTGVGVARDLVMRGLEVTLVERGPLTAGATGSMHGLLHSGARYALSDPESAAACLAENRTLREIAPHCVEACGGLFVEHPSDPDGHFGARRAACADLDIPTGTLTGEAAREREPGLAPGIERAFTVPDAAVDPFRLTADTARAAREHGATVLTHTAVVDVFVEDGSVSGAEVRPTDGTGEPSDSPGDRVEIDADYLVNATGAWAGQLAALAGLEVDVRASKGAMVVTTDRHTGAVINRCRPRGEGDILVPHGDVSILGTTDVAVEDPDAYSEERREVDLLFDELAPVVPSLAGADTLRSYWGVRPLYEPPDGGNGGSDGGNTADLTRDFVVLDHAERDGLWGMVTVVGGKLTTHRLMAERVADRVCGAFGIDRPCRTDEIPLPGAREDAGSAVEELDVPAPTRERSSGDRGPRAGAVLGADGPNPVVCPCREVTRAAVRAAMDEEGTTPTDLDAIRRRTGVGTGDCQGARCAHRVAALLHPDHDHATVARSLDAFAQERWDGRRHALWGAGLAGAAEAYDLHAGTMNRGRRIADPDLQAFHGGPAAGDGDDAGPETGAGGPP